MGFDRMAWEKVDDKTLSRLKEQKAFEDKVAKGLTFWHESFKNPFVRLFIHRIILDTMRHSDTYQMLIDLNEGAFISEASRETCMHAPRKLPFFLYEKIFHEQFLGYDDLRAY